MDNDNDLAINDSNSNNDNDILVLLSLFVSWECLLDYFKESGATKLTIPLLY